MLSKYFHLPTFIISLALGFFIVYIQSPNYTKIFVYPNPDNEDKILYKDRTNTCYKFKSKEVKCPANTSEIRSYPIQ